MWEGRDRVHRVRDRASEIIAEALEWPNPYFIPQDPCEIVFWDGTLDMLVEEAVLRLDDEFAIPDELWDRLCEITYGTFVGTIADLCGTEGK